MLVLYYILYYFFFIPFLQVDPEADSSLGDEDYLTKQLEAQVSLKKKLVAKFDVAKNIYDKALQMKMEQQARDKVEAYNAWRIAEEQKGRAQDDHGRNLVKIMLDKAKSETSKNAVTLPMCNVMGNVDGK